MKPIISRELTAKNLGKPRFTIGGKVHIAGVCLHDTAGTGKHNDTRYLANPGDGRAVSVDYCIERDGSIWQLNPDLTKFFTFHAGRATRFTDKNGRKFANRDVTRVLIGIELNQAAKMNLSPLWPAEQIQAAAELCLFLAQTFGFGKEQITTHQRIITDGSRTDPRKFPFSDFWFYFNKAANIPAVDNPAGPLGQPVMYEVVAGDSLWKIANRYQTTIEHLKALNGIDTASNLIKPGQKLIVKK